MSAVVIEPASQLTLPVCEGALPSIVQTRGLELCYGSFKALKGVSVDVHEHTVTALIGPSGCGKSTFLRCINRMNDMIEGASLRGLVTVDGQDIYARGIDPVELRKKVGMVFQKANPFPMSVFDNVAFGPRIHGQRRRSDLADLVEDCLRRAYLWDEVKDKLDESALGLSGGQQQRLCIARTIAVGPQVILMDEPCSALDPIATARIEELIAELKRDYTIVIVTHNMQQAHRTSDRTVFFMLGEVVEEGPTEQVFCRPRLQQTADYISGRFG